MHIVTLENKKDEKFLRRKTRLFDFARHTPKEIRELIKTMRDAMRQADGIGLSANQIGLDIAVFVARVGNKFYAVLNPKIVKISEEADELYEGCLSVPHKVGVVPRPSRLTLEGKDQRGKPIKIKAWCLLARVFQHETDHLNGILFANKAKEVDTITHDYDDDQIKR